MSDVEQKQTTDTTPVSDDVLMLGDKLKQARLDKGLTVGEVAERLKLAVAQVEALETNDPSRFPEPVFARGFFRSYARFLQLNEAEVLADLNKMFPSERVAVNHGQSNQQQASMRRVSNGKKLPKWLWMVGMVVVIVGVAVAWPKGESEEAVSDENGPLVVGELAAPQVVPPPVEAVAPDAAATAVEGAEIVEGSAEATAADALAAETEAAAPAAVAASGNGELVINIPNRSMLLVKDKDGEVLISKIVAAGSTHRFEGGAPYDVRIGYARSATMTFNDEAVDLSGAFIDKTTAAIMVPAND